MHKQREEDRISGAANKPSAEDEFDSRVRESEVRTRPARVANASQRYRLRAVETRGNDISPGRESLRPISFACSFIRSIYWWAANCGIY